MIQRYVFIIHCMVNSTAPFFMRGKNQYGGHLIIFKLRNLSAKDEIWHSVMRDNV